MHEQDELLNIGKYVRRYKSIQIHRVHASCTQQCNSYLVKTSDTVTVNIQCYFEKCCPAWHALPPEHHYKAFEAISL